MVPHAIHLEAETPHAIHLEAETPQLEVMQAVVAMGAGACSIQTNYDAYYSTV